ncbi:MAG TPA: aminoglycoside adenylyltransferase domain-containing protein [Chloroflexota bacterium]
MLIDFVASVRAALEPSFVGAYLTGSLALGDFDAGTSDIDIIVVTDGELPASVVAGLDRLHTRFRASGSLWAPRLEAAYVPLNALHIDVPPTALFPQVEKDREFGLYPVESGWVMQLCTLREHDLALAGPDPRSLIAPIAPDDVRRASAAHAVTWAQQARHDPAWLTWVHCSEHQVFVVLALCRMLYSLHTDRVTSKPKAAGWMLEATGSRWAELVRRAMEGNQGKGVVSDREVEETVTLIDYVAQQYQQWLESH